MTNHYTSSTAGTSTVVPPGPKQLELDLRDIEVIRWAFNASTSLLSTPQYTSMSGEKAVKMLALISEVDNKIYDQIAVAESGWEQLTLF